ncbi:MAG: ABC transporter ATP-binding protein [Prevotella sp.]|nr:ABC transporter ATP-binding protein [Prevotella sp.]MBP5508629.1 ABC transporter ATP-binding protein [Prevotella sp.]
METVKLKNLTIGYMARKNRKVVAEGINASLENARMTCLIGPNGVGKSTLLRTLSAFQPPLDGQVFIHDNDLALLREKQLAKLIGVVLTARPEVQNMTVEDMVGLGRSPYTGFWGGLSAGDRAIVDEAITMVGIDNLKGRMIQNLSDGERQKVMIAKALAQQTPVIFLDEPTAFLDYPSKVEMMQKLHQLSRTADKTIFLSTHDLELALQIADTVWLMAGPKQLSIGTPRELADSGALSAFIEQRGIVFDRERLSVRVMPVT